MTATLDILATPKAATAGMRVSVVQDQLAKALGIVGRATGNRNTMPILGHVLASTDGERLRLTATNLETSITAWVPARVLSDGVACLQSAVIRETIGALPGGRDVSIEAKGFALRVECERVGANLKGADPAEFPPINLFDGVPAVRIPAGDFRRAIEQVAFAAAKDEARPVLSGVNLRIGGGALRLSAADGFRLSIRTDALVGDTDDVDVIVPARAMTEVARACGVDADDVEIMIAPNRTQIGFSVPTASGRVLITTRLLEGTFPDLDRVVPAEAATTVTIYREALSRAVKVASIFARDSAYNIRLDVTADSEDGLVQGSVTVSGSSTDHGDNQT
ncbi:MAG: DNA polymerase III subunit beta, partial [Rhodobacteraceae bacterium]|nr:DNA polymerase III subunit beta [Paracoccaceae bacterium]